jgi:hypothetical protein
MIIAPWLAILPGFAIMVTVLAINLTADGAADIIDPKLKMSIFRRLAQKEPANGASTEQENEDAGATRSEPATRTPEPPDPSRPPPRMRWSCRRFSRCTI